MSIWQRWFGKTKQQELQQLLRQRRSIEKRGCFTDRELDEKDYDLIVLDRRIQALQYLQIRLRTQWNLQQQ